MMRRLNLYLFRQTTLAFIFTISALVAVVMFTQSFRVISLVANNSGTLIIFAQLMGLMALTFLPVLVPLSLGAAIVFTYYKLAIDSELVVMRSIGTSPLDLARPAFALAVIVTVLGYLLTFWITPWANRELVSLQYKVRDNFSIFMVRAGAFNDLADGLTFYVSDRGTSGELEDILIHDVRNPKTPVTIMAEKGHFTTGENGDPQIMVFKGKRQEINKETGRLSQLDFDRYVVDFQSFRTVSTPRSPDPREQYTGKLFMQVLGLDGDKAKDEDEATINAKKRKKGRAIVEFHQRITIPPLALGFCIMGVTAILAGPFNRRGMTKRIIVAALAIVALQTASLSMNSLIAKHNWLAPLLYIIVIAPIPVCFSILGVDKWLRLPFFFKHKSKKLST